MHLTNRNKTAFVMSGGGGVRWSGGVGEGIVCRGAWPTGNQQARGPAPAAPIGRRGANT